MVVVLKLRKQRNKYLTVKANEDNNIILDTSNITSTATFVIMTMMVLSFNLS